MCYVETKNLDGETNLKHKKASKEICKLSDSVQSTSDDFETKLLKTFTSATIECEKENESIYTFSGQMKLQEREMVISLDIDQMLLRGSSLRNTEYIYGISIYTGHDTKVMMNSSKSKPKFSKIEIAMNRYIIISILI
jgi:magnesium-transporting ATPase (P-type)